MHKHTRAHPSAHIHFAAHADAEHVKGKIFTARLVFEKTHRGTQSKMIPATKGRSFTKAVTFSPVGAESLGQC